MMWLMGLLTEPCAIWRKIVLHAGVTENDFKMINIDGYYVRTIDASKVDYLLCKFSESNRTFCVATTHEAC